MSIFRNVVFIAAAAGLFAGLVLAVLQTVYTSPLIIAAEAFEGGGEAEEGADAHASEGAHDHEAGGHHHDDEAWMPADGAERTFYTMAANVVTGIGFALLLVAVSEIAGGIGGWREGLLWGVHATYGGEISFHWPTAEMLEAAEMDPPMLSYGTVSRHFPNAAARGAGLTMRSLAESTNDTLAWWRSQPEERRANPRRWPTAEQEQAILRQLGVG